MTQPVLQSSSDVTPAPGPGRLAAIDTARFIAIVGMVAAHVALIPIPGLSLLVDGPPSTLFAILGGASAVLATRGRVARFGRAATMLSLCARGAGLVVLGFLLQLLPNVVTIVLVPFGVTLMLLAAFLPLRSRYLAVAIVVLSVGGPLANHVVRQSLSLDTLGELSFASPWAFLHSVLFTGTYPVVTWLAYALIGMVLIRAVLVAQQRGTVRTLGRRLTWWGLGASVLATAVSLVQVQLSVVPRLADSGIDQLTTHLVALTQSFGGPIGGGLDAILTASPHSGATGDIVRTAGLSLAVIGFLLSRSTKERAPMGGIGRIVRAGGSAPLTLYIVHVVAIGLLWLLAPGASAGDGPAAWWLTGPWAFAVQLTLVVAVSSVLAVAHRRGPFEAGLSTLSTAVAHGVARRTTPQESDDAADTPNPATRP